MKRVVFFALALLLLAGSVNAQYRNRDIRNLTQAQIDSVKQERLQFYHLESDRRERSIKAALLNEKLYVNANQANYDVRYYGLHVSLNFSGSSISGYVDYRLKSLINGLNSVDLNLHDQLNVDSVKVGSQKLTFSHVAGIVAITLPSSYSNGTEFAMKVFYHGYPYYGWGYTDGGMGFDYKNGYWICFTSCEPFYARNWWPCKDTPEDKADSLDMYIEYPSNYDVASNGVIVSNTDIGGGRKLIHYKHMYPITTYLIALTCADFDVTTTTWTYDGHTMPVYSYTSAQRLCFKERLRRPDDTGPEYLQQRVWHIPIR